MSATATPPRTVVVRLDAHADTLLVTAHRDAFSADEPLASCGRPLLDGPPAGLGTHLLDYPATTTLPADWASALAPGDLEKAVRYVGDTALARFDA